MACARLGVGDTEVEDDLRNAETVISRPETPYGEDRIIARKLVRKNDRFS